MNGGNLNDWVNPTSRAAAQHQLHHDRRNRRQVLRHRQADRLQHLVLPPGTELTDFYLQSTFDSGSCSGKDAYGLIIRGPEHLAGVSYGYVVAFSCDGQYWIFRLDGANPFTTKDLVSWTHSDYILAGPNKQNVMGIQAIGDTANHLCQRAPDCPGDRHKL